MASRKKPIKPTEEIRFFIYSPESGVSQTNTRGFEGEEPSSVKPEGRSRLADIHRHPSYAARRVLDSLAGRGEPVSVEIDPNSTPEQMVVRPKPRPTDNN